MSLVPPPSTDPTALPATPVEALGSPDDPAHRGAGPAKSVFLRNAGWLTAGRVFGDALGFLLFLVLSRHFGPEGMGEFAYGFALAALVYSLGMLGLDEYGVREMARRPPSEHPLLMSRLLATQTAAFAVMLVLLGGFLALTATGSMGAIVGLLTGYQVLLARARLLFAPALARQAMVGPAVAEMVCRASGMALTMLAVVVLRLPMASAMVGFAIGGIALLAMARISAGRLLGRLPGVGYRHGLVATAREAWAFGVSEIVYLLYARADLLLLTWIRGPGIAGIYAAALKFLEAGAMPVGYLGVAAYPVLSRLPGRGRAAATRAATRVTVLALWVSLIIAWVMFFLLPPVLVPLLGPSFRSAEPVLRWMALLIVLTGVQAMLIRLLMALRMQVRMLRVQVASTTLNILLNLLLIPIFGIPGAIVASAVMLVAVAALSMRILDAKLHATGVLRVLARPAAAALLSCVAAVAGWGAGLPVWAAAVLSLVPILAVPAVIGSEPGEERFSLSRLGPGRFLRWLGSPLDDDHGGAEIVGGRPESTPLSRA